MARTGESRRGFIKWLVRLVLASGLVPFFGRGRSAGIGQPARAHETEEQSRIHSAASKRSQVAVVRNSAVITESGNLNADVLAMMVHDAVERATGLTGSAAWSSLFSPKDVVGIKVNCLAGKRLSTRPEVVAALVKGLRRAGVPDENIVIWDRSTRELEVAGFATNVRGGRVQCYGTDGLPARHQSGRPRWGPAGYESDLTDAGSVGSLFSQILTSVCTALINVPVLKDHDLAGISLGMKNFFGAIHNPNRYHDNNCDPYIADLNNHPHIKHKLRLVVCDGITALYNGGPGFKPQWAWDFRGLLVGRDPVAVDKIGAEIVETKRKEAGLEPLREAGRPPRHITTAARLQLGTDDLSRIERIEVGSA